MAGTSQTVQLDSASNVEVTQKSTNAAAHVALSPAPVGVTMLNASSGNVAAAVAAATLAAAVGATTYLSGFELTGAGATAGLPVTVTVTGVLGGTLSYTYCAAVGALLPNNSLIVEFNPPLPASATNTAIVCSCPSLGVGNTNNTMVAHGFRV